MTGGGLQGGFSLTCRPGREWRTGAKSGQRPASRSREVEGELAKCEAPGDAKNPQKSSLIDGPEKEVILNHKLEPLRIAVHLNDAMYLPLGGRSTSEGRLAETTTSRWRKIRARLVAHARLPLTFSGTSGSQT
jgi:hypothetical protein